MATSTDRVRLRKSELFRSFGYEPHPAQVLVHRSKAPRRVVACGTRFGKSTVGAFEAIAALLDPRPQALGWLVCPTYELTRRIFERVVNELHAHCAHRVLKFDEREHRITVANFGGGVSELRAKSADRPVSLLGESLDFLIVDEATKLRDDTWAEHLAPRLLDRNGWVLLLSTPDGGGWFHKEFLRGSRKRPDPDYACWQFPSGENPHISADLIEAERARLSADQFAAQYEAKFVNVPIQECEVCHGPRRNARGGIILHDNEKPLRCPECNGIVGEDGETRVSLWPDGQTHTMIIHVHSPDPSRPDPPLPGCEPESSPDSTQPTPEKQEASPEPDDFGTLEMRTQG